MFKKYRNPLEKDLASSPFEEETTTTTTASPPRPLRNKETMPYRAPNAVPPRVFSQPRPSNTNTSPYTPSMKGQAPSQQEAFPSAPAEAQLHNDEPDTTLGEGVVFKGELTFKRRLRIDGQFEGDLVSKEGELLVGPTGVVKSNIKMRKVIIEGRVEGNITVTECLDLRSRAQVVGDIKAQLLSIDEGVSIIGHVAVTPNTELLEPPATTSE